MFGGVHYTGKQDGLENDDDTSSGFGSKSQKVRLHHLWSSVLSDCTACKDQGSGSVLMRDTLWPTVCCRSEHEVPWTPSGKHPTNHPSDMMMVHILGILLFGHEGEGGRAGDSKD